MYGNNRERERTRQKFKRNGFRQSHGGKDPFPGGEWGGSSEFGRDSKFRESDSYEVARDRPSPRRYTIDGVDFDPDERDDDLYDREHNRSRFAQTYSEGRMTRRDQRPEEEDHTGKGPAGYKRPDERIYEDVCEALFLNPSLDATDVDVTVKDGLVTLSGEVQTRFEKREAEDCIEDISGIIDVRNELQIKEIRQEH